MATPFVSLLIPTYNSALTVAETIESCCNQTFTDIEIILYDECSTDQTREIAQQAAARDPRIRVLTSETNSGPVRAWRKLLHEARGKYCTFVWSDDLIFPRYLEVLLGVLEKNPNDRIAGCSAYSEWLPEAIHMQSDSGSKLVTGEQSRKLLHDFETVRLNGDEYALGILAGVFPVSQICSLFKTDSAREVFDHYIDFENPYGFDFSRRAYGNDVSFLSELGLRSGQLTVVGEPLVSCRASPGSMTVNARKSHRWQYWLQYVWAIRSAWRRCRDLSPRMDALIRVVDDRGSFWETFYALQHKQLPREFNPVKIARALWFLKHHDRRMNPNVSPETIRNWLRKHS